MSDQDSQNPVGDGPQMQPPPMDNVAESAVEELREGLEKLKTELDAARKDRDELFDRAARIQAEFQNARKRLESDREQALRFANERIVRNLLPVLDNIERAVSSDVTDSTKVVEGLRIIFDQLKSTLTREGVSVLAPAVGEAFDPNFHEALLQQESDAYAEPSILQVIEKGYLLSDRRLRPARVIVSRPKES